MTDSATYEEQALTQLAKIPANEATEAKMLCYSMLAIAKAISEARK